MSRLVGLLLSTVFAVASLVVAGTAMAAPSVTTAEACVDGSSFEFITQFTDLGATDPIIFRIDAESDPLASPSERISSNFDPAGIIDFAQVETFGTPPFDRWLDGTISAADLTVTVLGGGSWRVEGTVPNGSQPLIVGDEVAFFVVRTGSGTTFTPNVPVSACAGAPSSFVSEVNLDDGAPWSPNTPGDTVATNGEGVVVETGQPIDVTMAINLNGTDVWRCTEVFIIDGIFVSETVDHADSVGAGPAFAGFQISAPPATGVYDMELTGYPNDDCTGSAIATITLLPNLSPVVEVIPPLVAIIDPTATIGNNVTFGGTVTIEAGAIIADRVALGDQVVVGPNTTVEADAILDDGTIVGANSIIGEAANLTFIINGVFTPTIVGDFVTIGTDAQVFGAQIGNSTDIGARVEIRSINNGIFAPASVGRDASIGDDSTVIGSVVRNGAVIGSDVDIVFVANGIFIPSTIGRNVSVGDGGLIQGTFIRTNATLASGVSTGTGSEIGHRASVGVGSSFGSHTIVRRDTIVGDNVQAGDDLIVRTGVVLGSDISLGNSVDFGKNSSAGNNVTIGNDVTVTPGASVPDGTFIPDGSTFP